MTDEPPIPDVPPPPPPPPPSVPPPSGDTVSPNRGLMIVLSYLWLLALVPLLTEKEDTEVQWHAKHGLVLLGSEIALFFALNIVGAVTGFLGCFFLPLLQLGILVLHVVCITKGLKGERVIVPVISDYADKL